MKLPALDDAKNINGSCHRLRAAFKGYEHEITWAILSPKLGPLLPGTLGALAIFASKRKGVFDEPLLGNVSISTRYWEKMLCEHGEKAKKLLTPTRAEHMLEVYRHFPRMLPCSPAGSKWCSACRSSELAEADWDPMMDRSDGNCFEHLLQVNAVRWGLNCRMVMDFTQLADVLEDVPKDNWNWEPQPIVHEIMQRAESKPDEESKLQDDIAEDNIIGSEHHFELENDSGYEGEPGVEERAAIFQSENVSLEPEVYSVDPVCHGDEIRNEEKAPHDSISSEDEIDKKGKDKSVQRIQPVTRMKFGRKKRSPITTSHRRMKLTRRAKTDQGVNYSCSRKASSQLRARSYLKENCTFEASNEPEIHLEQEIRHDIELFEQKEKEREFWLGVTRQMPF